MNDGWSLSVYRKKAPPSFCLPGKLRIWDDCMYVQPAFVTNVSPRLYYDWYVFSITSLWIGKTGKMVAVAAVKPAKSLFPFSGIFGFYRIRKYPSGDELAVFCPSLVRHFVFLNPGWNKNFNEENGNKVSTEFIGGMTPIISAADLEVRR